MLNVPRTAKVIWFKSKLGGGVFVLNVPPTAKVILFNSKLGGGMFCAERLTNS